MKTAAMMWTVAAALVPAAAASALAFGEGVWIQLAAATFAAVVAGSRLLDGSPRRVSAAADGSAAVCGMIVGLSVPPLAPWWCAALRRPPELFWRSHCYGGLGNNRSIRRWRDTRWRLCRFRRSFPRGGRDRRADSVAGRATFGGSGRGGWECVAVVVECCDGRRGDVFVGAANCGLALAGFVFINGRRRATVFGEMSAGTHLRSGGVCWRRFLF